MQVPLHTRSSKSARPRCRQENLSSLPDVLIILPEVQTINVGRQMLAATVPVASWITRHANVDTGTMMLKSVRFRALTSDDLLPH